MKTKSVLLLLGVWLMTLLNWRLPFLRFSNHWANVAFVLLASLLPFGLIGTGLVHLGKYRPTEGSRLLTLGLLLLSLPLFAVVVVEVLILPPLANEDDASFAKIAQIEEQIALYRTNGGATTEYGLVVRQEQRLLPGVLLVKQVFSKYGISYLNYTKAGNHLTIMDPASTLKIHEVELKRYVYF
jgi:amino acid transporter